MGCHSWVYRFAFIVAVSYPAGGHSAMFDGSTCFVYRPVGGIYLPWLEVFCCLVCVS